MRRNSSDGHSGFSKCFCTVCKTLLFVLPVWLIPGCFTGKNWNGSNHATIWKLADTTAIGGLRPTILGAPVIVSDQEGKALSFDGIDDGLMLPVNPLQGWKMFTVELLFKPLADGPTAPRLIHCQDKEGNRCTIEIRVTPQGQWYLDTFLKNGQTNKGLTLIDSLNVHPCGKWYWVSLVYDGKIMTHYVNAIKEGEGTVAIPVMNTGQISLGARLNRVDWFKGLIREVRFHPEVLDAKALQHY
jgi:hypothetical protein